jgi:hypothetical protein
VGIERDLVSVNGIGLEAEAEWDYLGTPETYLGDGRGLGQALRSMPNRLSGWQ